MSWKWNKLIQWDIAEENKLKKNRGGKNRERKGLEKLIKGWMLTEKTDKSIKIVLVKANKLSNKKMQKEKESLG